MSKKIALINSDFNHYDYLSIQTLQEIPSKIELLVHRKKKNDKVVVKRVLPTELHKDEIILMQSCIGVDYIIQMVAYRPPSNFFKEHRIYLEFCARKDLFYYQKYSEENRIPLNEIKMFLKQITQGLTYLHKKNICHRDIKRENIFLTDALSVKIADFGYATKFKPDDEFEDLVGTVEFLPPEFFTKKKHTFKIDAWELGCLLFSLFNVLGPFDVENGLDFETLWSTAKKKILQEGPDYIQEDLPPMEAAQLLDWLMSTDPNRRPLMSEVLLHPFLL